MTEWISVKDRLPEDNARVMVFCNDPHLGKLCRPMSIIIQYSRDRGWYDKAEKYRHVSHWMPLPEPPHASTEYNGMGRRTFVSKEQALKQWPEAPID